MTRLFIYLLGLTLLAGVAPVAVRSAPGVTYKTYTNARFGYAVDYPNKLLKPQGEAANGDGQAFRSANGQVEMLAYGGHNALDQKLKDVYDEEIQNRANEGGSVTYKVLRGNFFVVSGKTGGGRIFYRKTFYKRADDVFVTFSIEYPSSQKATYDAVTSHIAQSFKP